MSGNFERMLSTRVRGNRDLDNLVSLFSGGKGPKTHSERAVALLAGGSAAWSLYKQAVAKLEERQSNHMFTVAIDADDEIYPLIRSWVLRQMTPVQQKALNVYSVRITNSSNVSNVIARMRQRIATGTRPAGAGIPVIKKDSLDLITSYDGSREQTIILGGHKIKVQVEKPGGNGGGGSVNELEEFGMGASSSYIKVPRIVFTSTSVAGRDVVIETLREVLVEYDKERTDNRLYTANKWGDWIHTSGIPPRSLDTVVLAKDVVEDLMGDISTFLSSEARYAALGLPWHRGYLLSGPPGTGKTSLVKAVATEMGLDTYYMPLSDLGKDTDLNSLVQSITSRGLLLIEDIDVASSSRERDDKAGGVTTAGLLNALDGVATPHGLITVMTTNKEEVLDKALTRPGRSDRIFHIDYMKQEQYKRLCQLVAGREVDDLEIADISGHENLSPAEVLEWAKMDLTDPELALAAVTKKTFEWVDSQSRSN